MRKFTTFGCLLICMIATLCLTSCSKSTKEQLKAEVEQTKAKLPTKISEGITAVDCSMKDNVVSFTYRLDSAPDSIDESQVEAVKQEVIASLKQAYAKQIADMVKDNIKFDYTYQDPQGTELYKVSIDSKELQ